MSDVIKPLKQKHVEAFMRQLRENIVDPTAPFKDKELAEQVETMGIITRAAAEAGMLNGAQPDDMEPWEVSQLSGRILNAVWESLTPPKASTSPSSNMPTAEESPPTN